MAVKTITVASNQHESAGVIVRIEVAMPRGMADRHQYFVQVQLNRLLNDACKPLFETVLKQVENDPDRQPL